MEASNEMGLKLIGFWASPFCLVVEVALKLKGFTYDYQEENLEEGKSESLLRYNPIYKSVPVFIHDARPIVESLVILEYLEDLLREPPLLPADPFARARVRFWVDFFYKKIVPPLRSIVVKEGVEQEKVISESTQHLRTLEQAAAEEFPTETPFFCGDLPGLLDIVFGSTVCWIRVLEELTGSQMMSKETTPVLCRRIESFTGCHAVKEAMPKHEKLLAYARRLRERILALNAG
ncbi:hypothetical protein HPP92_003914 [Vanilla planifolia]|uniref:Glutathione S-transferase n=1 Tax=Vanilla planifolia TaxID=51239 RepID=A0A835VLY1_VANPL|nr:hypothetical protein HPP92_004329 [Vanilla planifolia]KAG0503842.1 hypothetical protein HPP92_003914 [Vanilla planifolia]